MLRTIFVIVIILTGTVYAAQGPFYALLFYLWNAYFRPEEWIWTDWLSGLNLSFAIGVYLVVRTIGAMPGLKVNLRTSLIWLIAGQAVIGTIFSEHPERSYAFLNGFIKVLIISYLIVVLVDTRQKLRLTLIVISVSLGFETVKQGWANLILYPGSQNNNSIPFLGDNNGVALGTMMLAPIVFALAGVATKRWERLGFRLAGIGILYRGLSTYSRGGFVAAAALAALTFLRSEHKVRAMFAIVVLAVASTAVMPQAFWDRMDTIRAPTQDLDTSAAGRLHFWKVAVDMAAQNPVTGVGLNGFLASYQSYNRSGQFSGDRAAHSIWFGILADLGYPGLFLFVAIWSISVFSCWRVQRRCTNEEQRELRLYATALMTSLIVYGVAGSFLSHHYNEMAWHFFGLSTALHLVAMAEARSPAGETGRAPLRARHPAMAR